MPLGIDARFKSFCCTHVGIKVVRKRCSRKLGFAIYKLRKPSQKLSRAQTMWVPGGPRSATCSSFWHRLYESRYERLWFWARGLARHSLFELVVVLVFQSKNRRYGRTDANARLVQEEPQCRYGWRILSLWAVSRKPTALLAPRKSGNGIPATPGKFRFA